MKKVYSLLFIVLFLLVFVTGFNPVHAKETKKRAAGELWPVSKPYKTGYFKVSELHTLFYQLGGNAKGKPVMVLHGGPGQVVPRIISATLTRKSSMCCCTTNGEQQRANPSARLRRITHKIWWKILRNCVNILNWAR